MDHEIQDDPDLGAARRKGCQALGGDIARVRHGLLEIGHDRVVMLDMSDLHDAVCLGRGAQNLGGLIEGDADGLLNQKMDAFLQQREGDRGMVIGRHDDADGVAAGRHLVERGEPVAVMLGANLCRPSVIRLKDAGEFSPGECGVDAGVVLAERTRAGHPAADARCSHAERLHGHRPSSIRKPTRLDVEG